MKERDMQRGDEGTEKRNRVQKEKLSDWESNNIGETNRRMKIKTHRNSGEKCQV